MGLIHINLLLGLLCGCLGLCLFKTKAHILNRIVTSARLSEKPLIEVAGISKKCFAILEDSFTRVLHLERQNYP